MDAARFAFDAKHLALTHPIMFPFPADLKYARWSELKHGRIAMLAIVGMVVQSAGIHLPGDAYTNPDPFGAPSTVGWAVNIQIFLFMSCVEIATFNKTYGEGTPGDLGWNTPDLISKLSPADLAKRNESEIVHCRLAMIAITGAAVQYLLYGKLGL
jgi:Chlorophyll A-B binding protein